MALSGLPVSRFVISQFSGSVAPTGYMHCAICASDNLKAFNGELAVHFSGWAGLDKRPLLVFPDMIVCLACGLVEFGLPVEHLWQLRNEDSVRHLETRI
jgi:hypothetical protein